jgi:hypothetical protein
MRTRSIQDRMHAVGDVPVAHIRQGMNVYNARVGLKISFAPPGYPGTFNLFWSLFSPSVSRTVIVAYFSCFHTLFILWVLPHFLRRFATTSFSFIRPVVVIIHMAWHARRNVTYCLVPISIVNPCPYFCLFCQAEETLVLSRFSPFPGNVVVLPTILIGSFFAFEFHGVCSSASPPQFHDRWMYSVM